MNAVQSLQRGGHDSREGRSYRHFCAYSWERDVLGYPSKNVESKRKIKITLSPRGICRNRHIATHQQEKPESPPLFLNCMPSPDFRAITDLLRIGPVLSDILASLLIAVYSTLKLACLSACRTFPMKRWSSLSATKWWSWHPPFLGHICLLGSEQEEMYIFSSFAWWRLQKFVFFFYLIHDNINKNQMSLNSNLRRTPLSVSQSLLSSPIINCECFPPFHTTSFLQTPSFPSVLIAISTSLMVLIMFQLPQNMYSRKWKYDLGISNLKLQFKDHSFFFCLENLTNVTDWAGQSLRTYFKC